MKIYTNIQLTPLLRQGTDSSRLKEGIGDPSPGSLGSVVTPILGVGEGCSLLIVSFRPGPKEVGHLTSEDMVLAYVVSSKMITSGQRGYQVKSTR